MDSVHRAIHLCLLPETRAGLKICDFEGSEPLAGH